MTVNTGSEFKESYCEPGVTLAKSMEEAVILLLYKAPLISNSF